MSKDTVKERAQKRDHALTPDSWGLSVETYFKGSFARSVENERAQRRVVWRFLYENLVVHKSSPLDLEQWWRATDELIEKSEIKRSTVYDVQRFFIYYWLGGGRKFGRLRNYVRKYLE